MDKFSINEIVAGMQKYRKHIHKSESSEAIQKAIQKSATKFVTDSETNENSDITDSISIAEPPVTEPPAAEFSMVESKPMTSINLRFESNESENLNDRTPSSKSTEERSIMWQPGTKIPAIENCHVTAINASVSNKVCSDSVLI